MLDGVYSIMKINDLQAERSTTGTERAGVTLRLVH